MPKVHLRCLRMMRTLLSIGVAFLCLAFAQAAPSVSKTDHASARTSLPDTALVATNQTQLLLDPNFKIEFKPQHRYFDWTISAMNGDQDGFRRTMFVVNGQAEGPLIEANNGDTIHVRVVNSLSDGITLHWHGISQNHTTWSDGPSGVSQCPIPAGQEYTYTFELSRPDQYGTYWWHAHRAVYYADGLTGPLIVHSVDDPLRRGVDYDIDQIVMLKDNYHALSETIVTGIRSTTGFDGTTLPPSPKSGLINGKGYFDCSLAPKGTKCTQALRAPTELVFPPNRRIRIRFINDGTHSSFQTSIDDHALTVIEVDDTPVKATSFRRLQINTAQRYSVVISTHDDAPGHAFYLRARINTDCLPAPFADLEPEALAVIRVVEPGQEASKGEPTTHDWTDEPIGGPCVDPSEELFIPRVTVDAPASPDQRHFFNTSLSLANNETRWTINDVSFDAFAYDPLLFQVARHQTLNASQITHLTAKGPDTIDLVINNVLGAAHPFHLHQAQMWIVARGDGLLDAQTAKSIRYSVINPLRRDTLSVAPASYVVVRFIADIVGVYAFHCHIAWHQAAGLYGAVVAQPEAIAQLAIPASARALCDASNIPAGLTTTTPEPARFRRSHLSY